MPKLRRIVLLSTLALGTCRVSDLPAQIASKTGPGAPVSSDEFGDKGAASCLILLHGASGTAQPFYAEQARFFGAHGFHVLMPHYFDATHSTDATPGNERQWVAVVDAFVARCRQQPSTKQVFLIGYSLGASVALAAGSQGAAVDGIAEWYGSLPDEFFNTLKAMPPLLILHGTRDTNIPVMNGEQLVKLCEMRQLECDHTFYPDQGHGFVGSALNDAEQRTLAFFARLSKELKESRDEKAPS